MRVVVLMSTYNGERYLREQIESILNQIGEFDLSLYVRDDGSKDGTIEILREYQNEKKLKWYTGDNLGPAKSFINLLQNCGAYDYYAFADQDDVWEKDKIQRGINVLEEQNGPALYCSNAELVDLQLISLGRNVYKTMPRTDFETVISAGGLLGCTMVFNDELKRRIKRDRYPVMILHDFYMAALCVSIGGVILYDQEATMKYRQHEDNVVGVSYGKIGTLMGRIRDIFYRNNVSIAEQARDILCIYGNEINSERGQWLDVVSHYKDGFVNRLRFASSKKMRYINKNMSMKIRLSILMGNR